MPRIRTIKPEFCVSEQIAECSTNARLLFVLMWCFCDDAGRHPANTKRLKMEVFPGDEFTDTEIRKMVDELIKHGLLLEYEYEKQRFFEVTGWKRHQKIDRPSYKHGPFTSDGTPSYSSNDRRILGERSVLSDPRKGMEGNGMEGSGEESSVCGVVESSTTPPAATPKSTEEPEQLTDFEFALSDGSSWFLGKKKLGEYQKTFPFMDVPAELRRAGQWTRDNPKRRKTKTGMHAFIGSWLSRVQNKPQMSDPLPRGLQTTEDGYYLTDSQKKLANNRKAIEDFING